MPNGSPLTNDEIVAYAERRSDPYEAFYALKFERGMSEHQKTRLLTLISKSPEVVKLAQSSFNWLDENHRKLLQNKAT